jgi:hypothetical protein
MWLLQWATGYISGCCYRVSIRRGTRPWRPCVNTLSRSSSRGSLASRRYGPASTFSPIFSVFSEQCYVCERQERVWLNVTPGPAIAPAPPLRIHQLRSPGLVVVGEDDDADSEDFAEQFAEAAESISLCRDPGQWTPPALEPPRQTCTNSYRRCRPASLHPRATSRASLRQPDPTPTSAFEEASGKTRTATTSHAPKLALPLERGRRRRRIGQTDRIHTTRWIRHHREVDPRPPRMDGPESSSLRRAPAAVQLFGPRVALGLVAGARNPVDERRWPTGADEWSWDHRIHEPRVVSRARRTSPPGFSSGSAESRCRGLSPTSPVRRRSASRTGGGSEGTWRLGAAS